MIIVLYPYPFSNYFLNKFKLLEIQKKLKVPIEYIDLSKILYPNKNKFFSQSKNKKVLEFQTINQWKKYMSEKTKDKKIYILNLLSQDSYQSFKIHYYLKNLNSNIIQYKSAETLNQKRDNNLVNNIKKGFFLLFTNPSRLKFIFNERFFSKMISLLRFKKLIILYSGKKKFIQSQLNSHKVKFIKYNSNDYFNYLEFENKNLKKIKKKKIIYLDSRAPFITDRMMFGYNYKYDVMLWYKVLNRFLKNVENIFQKKIVIVPHPRSRDDFRQLYDKSFKVLRKKDATIKSIKNSYFVIANSPTTATSYCILYNKPINFIFNNQQKLKMPESVLDTKLLAKYLNTKCINSEKKITKKNFQLKPNKKYFNRYKYNFLTSKETCNKSVFKIWKTILN